MSVFRHTVLMKFKPGTTTAALQQVIVGLRQMPALMDFIRRYELGPDLSLIEGTWDLALVADFDSEADYRRYAENREHRAVIEHQIRPILEEMARVQYLVE